ncbi:unnamed protein product [Macrosiphum euphorbiae]|uniref:Regulatory protein zeste n=1 Tax=Macrosiphum euphorbiae TaxID=13131 RepID=A0AAV0XG87_9HEMI|nr:unnamed protein product [Macrosiphum euphorbiae]
MSERKRESNFTNAEIDLLLHLCNTNKKILENKTTNAVTWKEKILAWEKIHTQFNSTTDGPSRSIKNLRSKYDSMKKEVRKSVAKQKKYVTGTGGGPFISEVKLSPALEQLHQNIKLSSDGLICQFDSDSSHINLKSTEELDFSIMMEEIDDPSILEENILDNNSPTNPTDTIRVNFSDYNATMLQTGKPKELKSKISTDIVVDQLPTSSASLFKKSSSLEQTRIHFSKKKKSTVSSVATNYNDLCTSKAELVERELNLLGKKEQEDTIEHQLRTKKLKLEIEKLELEILLLKKSTV